MKKIAENGRVRNWPAPPQPWHVRRDRRQVHRLGHDEKIINDNMTIEEAQEWAQGEMMDSYNKFAEEVVAERPSQVDGGRAARRAAAGGPDGAVAGCLPGARSTRPARRGCGGCSGGTGRWAGCWSRRSSLIVLALLIYPFLDAILLSFQERSSARAAPGSAWTTTSTCSPARTNLRSRRSGSRSSFTGGGDRRQAGHRPGDGLRPQPGHPGPERLARPDVPALGGAGRRDGLRLALPVRHHRPDQRRHRRSSAWLDDYLYFFNDARLALPALILVVIWSGTPFWTMNILAGMQAIPQELYEAAEIDGAGTLPALPATSRCPSLQPVMFVTALLSTIWTSANLTQIFVLTGGGPNYATMTVPLLSYLVAIPGTRSSALGAAISMTMVPFYMILVYFLTRRMLRQERVSRMAMAVAQHGTRRARAAAGRRDDRASAGSSPPTSRWSFFVALDRHPVPLDVARVDQDEQGDLRTTSRSSRSASTSGTTPTWMAPGGKLRRLLAGC